MAARGRPRSLWTEFGAGVLVVADPLPDEPEDFAFKTMVQIDGDVCLTIDRRALALPNLQALLDAHIQRVADTLADRLVRVRRIMNWIYGFGTLVSTGSAAVVFWRDDEITKWTQSLLDMQSELLATSLDYVLAVGLGVVVTFVTRAGIQRQLRKHVRPLLTLEDEAAEKLKL